jgi:hypothetical protein
LSKALVAAALRIHQLESALELVVEPTKSIYDATVADLDASIELTRRPTP